MALLINDGYTLEKTIPARGQVPAVTFRYRPALPDAVHEWRYQTTRAKSGAATALAEAELLKTQLVSWDVTDAKGATVPITLEALAKIHHRVRSEMLDAVLYGIEEAEADVKNS